MPISRRTDEQSAVRPYRGVLRSHWQDGRPDPWGSMEGALPNETSHRTNTMTPFL